MKNRKVKKDLCRYKYRAIIDYKFKNGVRNGKQIKCDDQT